MGFVVVFEAMGCFYDFCLCQEVRPSLSEEDFQRGSKRQLDALRIQQEKCFKCYWIVGVQMVETYKTTNSVKQHICEHFPCRRSLSAEQLLEERKTEKIFGYVQCDIEIPEKVRSKSDDISPIFKNSLASKYDVADLKGKYAEKKCCLNLEKCWHPASHYKLEHFYSSAVVSSTISSCLRKNNVLSSTLEKNASTALCSQQWKQGKVTKMQTQVSWQKQWSFKPAAPTVTRPWIGANTL